MPWSLRYDAWDYAVRFLARTPEGLPSRQVLSTMNARQLFGMATQSEKLYTVVANYLDFLKDGGLDVEDEASGSDMSSNGEDMSDDEVPQEEESNPNAASTDTSKSSAVNRLPAELGLQILRDLPLVDRLRWARCNRDGALATAASLQEAAVSILSTFDLRFGEVRLMQTAMGSVISGSTIPHLMNAGNKFMPNDLDFYTPRRRGYDVSQFLQMGDTYDFAAGIGKVFTLQHSRTGRKINVIESLTDRPLDSLAHFHSTCVFGAWTARGLWHAYPRLTMDGFTMTTACRLPLRDDLEQHKRVWNVVNKYTVRGFKFLLDEFPPAHICGQHKSCPMTIRTSDDAGCLSICFPSWEFNHDIVENRPTCWSLNGTGCQSGVLTRASSAVETSMSYWKWMIHRYVISDYAPESVVMMNGNLL
ncbi:hypothetical protein DFH06DRAFT_1135703 [Mycena polygramma]|nr:hypothetical protein DFH06DRAFT_1135703 [Mycena polygramma]